MEPFKEHDQSIPEPTIRYIGQNEYLIDFGQIASVPWDTSHDDCSKIFYAFYEPLFDAFFASTDRTSRLECLKRLNDHMHALRTAYADELARAEVERSIEQDPEFPVWPIEKLINDLENISYSWNERMEWESPFA